MTTQPLTRCLLESVEGAGRILLAHFGRIAQPRRKENRASVVCEADLTAERFIMERIRRQFPAHGIIAEESGCQPGDGEFTWVIDPLDGTSNFVAGIPWFGAQIGVLRGNTPILGAMYLPGSHTLYFAETGRGAFRNRERVRVTTERKLENVLCALGMDATGGRRELLANAKLMLRVASAVRNVRTTNSLVDFCYTVDGRLGGCINLNTKIWDIVPGWLALQEAGGTMTGLEGHPITFDLSRHRFDHNYAILGAGKKLHRPLVRLCTA